MPKEDCVIKCQNCAHYKEDGTCHRYPPVPLLTGEGAYWAFPDVDADDYCGEFEGKS